MSKFAEKISEGFMKNPVAWFLFVLLLVAVHGGYQRGKDLTRVCELTGPHDVTSNMPKDDQELHNICRKRLFDFDE